MVPDPDLDLLNVQELLSSQEMPVLDLANIYNLSKEHLSSVKDLLPKLRSLNLSCCHTLTDQDFVTLVGFETTDSQAKGESTILFFF